MRTTLTIDDEVYEAARALAEASGKRLGEVLSELARRGLKSRGSEKAVRNRNFPVFKVPPQARIIPAKRAAELLAEDSR
jgi:hypothetical protein